MNNQLLYLQASKSILRRTIRAGFVTALAFAIFQVAAQTPPQYGAPISLDVAKKVTEAAVAEMKKNNWNMVFAVTDAGGHLVYLQRVNGAQTASVEVAIAKAKSAASFRRSTKLFEERVQTPQGVNVLALPLMPHEGGLPIIIGGKLVGAIGVSGGSASQDGVAAKAGIDAAE